MNDPIFSDIDNQVELIEKSLQISKCIKEKYLRIFNEKQVALQKCAELEDKLARMTSEKCIECSVLRSKLIIERREKEQIKKGEKATLLKRIAEMVASLDDRNHQMTNAQFLTQLVCGGLNDSPPSKERREITLIDEKPQGESSLVLVNETIVEDSEESSNECDSNSRVPIIIPETEQTDFFQINTKTSEIRWKNDISLKKSRHNVKDSGLTTSNSNEENDFNQRAKKLKLCSSFEQENRLENGPSSSHTNNYTVKKDADPPEAVEDGPCSSPSVFSQTIIEHHNTQINERANLEGVGNTRLTRDTKEKEDKPAALWKLKPSLTMSNASAVNGKKLKQTTLYLARPESKHDISLNQGFKGGLPNKSQKYYKAQRNDEKDVILPSPDKKTKNSFNVRKESFETLEDPDVTVFQPVVTSTCLPGAHNSSFDRLPERATSPSFKYRRETVRKREERMKLPGQQCDDCAKYYEAAGLNKTQEVRERMNKCSRHRDKYDVQVHTPPGFWDPVIPVTPEGSQD